MDSETIFFFSHKKLSEHMYIFTENFAPGKSRSIAAAVSGDRIVTVDAGCGAVGNLRAYIESTIAADKQRDGSYHTTCICTSGVPENVGGSGCFDAALISAGDIGMTKFMTGEDHRRSVLAKQSLNNPVIAAYCENCKDTLIDNSSVSFSVYNDPDNAFAADANGEIRLDDALIRITAFPGATPGSLAVSVFTDGQQYICTGEGLGIDTTYMMRVGRDMLVSYQEALQRLIDSADEKTRFISAASPIAFDVSVARNVSQAVAEILGGKTQGDIPAEMIIHGKKSEDDFRLHYVNNNSVLYNATMLNS